MKTLITLVLVLALPLLAVPRAEPVPPSVLEEHGIDDTGTPRYDGKTLPLQTPVLLIPDSGNDLVAMFDPADGTYLGDFIVDDPTGTMYDLEIPINAVDGPDDLIFVSDQVSGAVYNFDMEGQYVNTAISDINNVRGIDFRGDTLYATSGDGMVAIYSGPDVYEGDFISGSISPFDILFLPDGTSLLSEINGDVISHYDENGANPTVVISASFPEQVQFDAGASGHFLTGDFTGYLITEFMLDGTIIDTWALDEVRAAYRLSNGNILATNSDGVHEIDPATGVIIETEYYGNCRFIELVEVEMTGIEESSSAGSWTVGLSVTPNPFGGHTNISFQLPSTGSVSVDVYSISGRVVRSIQPGTMEAGTHSIAWDGTDSSGQPLGQGVYFVRVNTSGGVFTRKVNLLR